MPVFGKFCVRAKWMTPKEILIDLFCVEISTKSSAPFDWHVNVPGRLTHLEEN